MGREKIPFPLFKGVKNLALITPDTYIKLVRFDVTKEHQITFSTKEAQKQFFSSLQGVEMTAVRYQRKDYKIRFNALIDDIINYNYLYYYNDVNDRIYYCYVTDMEYVNDNLTDVVIKTDVFQTYQFDFVYKKCFIEREHVNDDTPGKNVVPEGLEHGEYITNDMETFDKFNRTCYVIQATKDLTSQHNIVYGTEISGLIFSGTFMLCFSYADVLDIIQQYESNQNLGIDCVLNVYIIPYALTSNYIVEPDPPLIRTKDTSRFFNLQYFYKINYKTDFN